MAKLVYVGPNPRNWGGMSSKAYTIRRRGRTVLTRYGSVQSVGGGGGRLHWVSHEPRENRCTFRTEKMAAAFIRKTITQKEGKGYDRLPGRVRIYPAPQARLRLAAN